MVCDICKGLDQYGEPSTKRELKPNSRFGTCQVCRSSQHRWAKRRPAEILNYRRKLHVYDLRISSLVDTVSKKKTNVVPFQKRKRKAA